MDNTAFWSGLALWSALVVSTVWAVARLLPRPRLKSALILTAFCCALLPFWPGRTPTHAASLTPQPSTELAQTVSGGLTPTPDYSSISAPTPAPSNPFPWTTLLVGLWMTGAGIGLLGVVVSVLRMNSFSRSANPSGPMAAGFPKARILLPAGWPGDLTPNEAEAALAHERAHIRNWHVAGRVIIEMFRCWLWWLPTAHLAVAAYEAALEDIADTEALKVAEPAVLASALLKVASNEVQPRLCTGATRRGRDLEGRLHRIMDRRPPGRVSTSLVTGLAVVSISAAVAPKTPLLQGDTSGNFGLKQGALWTYSISFDKGQYGYGYRVAKAIPEKGMAVFELRTIDKQPGYLYQAVSSEGLFALHNERMSGPGYDKNAVPDPLLKAPFKVGNSWKWHAPFRGQTMQSKDGDVPKWDDMATDYTAKIEAEETVTVPAGSFKCFRVHVTGVSREFGNSDRTDWISLDAGLVKRQTAGNDNPYSLALKSFAPGRD